MSNNPINERNAEKTERRIYPEQVVECGGMTYIPTMLFRAEMELKYADKVYLCYLLSKSMDWIYYDSFIAEETGIGLSTIYEMNKRLSQYFTQIPTNTGLYGTGYRLNFSKLYAKCIEVGIQNEKKAQKKKEDRQIQDEAVRNLEIDFQELVSSLRQEPTTNTNTNTETNIDNNTTLSMESGDSKIGFGRNTEEGVPPCGGTQDRAVEAERDASEAKQDVLDSKASMIDYIIEKQFGQIHYRTEKKDEFRMKLFRMSISDLKMIIQHAELWSYWCKEISPSHGLTSLKSSDFGLPLLLSPSILKKYLTYIKNREADELAEKERIRVEAETIAKMEKEAAMKASRMKAIEAMPLSEKIAILKSFRFDREGDGYCPKDDQIEDIAKDNFLGGIGDEKMLYNILFRKYKKYMYEGMDDLRRWKAGIAKYSETKRLSILNTFDLSKLLPEIRISKYDLEKIASRGHVDGNREVLFKILEHHYPEEYYEKTIRTPEKDEAILKAIQDEEEQDKFELAKGKGSESSKNSTMANTLNQVGEQTQSSHEEFEARLLASLLSGDDD